MTPRAAPVRKPLVIDFACNDPDNGVFAGRVIMAHVGAHEAELECDDWENGYAFTEGGNWIRLHRRKFEIVGRKYGEGNWAWNGYTFPRSEGIRLLDMMRRSGRWKCTGGATRFYDWLNKFQGDE